jgi:uncharacterized OsmC-like protein
LTRTTPKQWTLKVISPAVGPLQVLRDGAPLPAEIGPGLTTPVDLLLASVATCFALSCHMAFSVRGSERVGLEVSVTGRKAPQLPSRLAEMDIAVVFDASLPAEDAQAISALAKQMCTVTNTLASGDKPIAVSTTASIGLPT